MRTRINKAIFGAIRRGYLAREANIFDCPYKERGSGNLGGTGQFVRAWWTGWNMCAHDRAMGDNDGWYADRIPRHKRPR
jgi:hypothetical protein